MKKGFIAIIGIVIVIIITLGWFFTTRNSLISLSEDCKMKESQIQTVLQEQMDLIPNLVETVKAYAKHEEKVFTEIADARSKLAGAIESTSIEDVANASTQFESALGRLLAIQESYPELKADTQFTGLRDSIEGMANRVRIAREYYNEQVAVYNKKVQFFPSSVVANMSEFSKLPYFEASEKAQESPVVNFY